MLAAKVPMERVRAGFDRALFDELANAGVFLLRNDGFSKFAQDDQRKWFPKVSAAWTFTTALNDNPEEDWLGVFSFGKARPA